MTLIYLTLGWTIGILLSWHIGEALPLKWSLVLGGLVAIWWWVRRDEQLSRAVRRGLWIFVFGVLGFLHMDAARPATDPGHVARLNGLDTVTLSGVVRDVPQVTDFGVSVRLAVDDAQALNRHWAVHGQVLVSMPPTTDVRYGDRLTVRGPLQVPPQLDEFSYAGYLARREIFSVMRTREVQILARRQGHPLRHVVLDVRHRAHEFIGAALPEPQAGLLTGILLGDEQGLSPEVEDAFNATGTSHIIAISGFNMSLIAGLVIGLTLALFRRRSVAVLVSLGVLALYTMLVGGNAAVVRAAIMGGVLVVAPLVQRKTYLPATLAFTVLLMSALNPFVFWDIGFQLSFVAVLGMALFVPPADRWLGQRLQNLLGPRTGSTLATWLSEPVVVTLVAQAVTLPIILHYFRRLPLLSPLANFLIIPVQPLILMIGGLATLVSFVSAPLGRLLYGACWLFLTYTVEVVRGLAAYDSDLTVHVSSTGLALFLSGLVGYMLLSAARPAWYRHWRQAIAEGGTMRQLARVWPVLPVLAGIILLGNLGQRLVNQPDERLHVIFLNMSHSHSVLIRTPQGGTMLIDGGRFPSRLLTALGDYLPPDTEQLDVLWLSSDQAIDMGALPSLLDRYRVQAVIAAPQPPLNADYVALLDGLTAQGVPITPAETGRQVRTGDGVMLTVLAPAPDASALVLRLEYGEVVFLLTTDLNMRSEAALLDSQAAVQATVLQAGRHAALGSNSPAWIEAVAPQVVVIQTDPNAFQDETDESVVAQFAGRRVYRTDQHGTVEIITDGQTLEIVTQTGD